MLVPTLIVNEKDTNCMLDVCIQPGVWSLVYGGTHLHRDNGDTNRMLDIGSVDWPAKFDQWTGQPNIKAWLSTRGKKAGHWTVMHLHKKICWVLEKTIELSCSFTTAKYVE